MLRSPGLMLTGLGAAVALLYYGQAFCITIAIAIILAFLLEPLVGLLMRIRVPRGVAAFLVCTAALLVLYLAGLAAFTQVISFADDLPDYSARVNTLVDRVAAQLEETERNFSRLLIPRRFQEKIPVPEPQATGTKKRRQAVAQQPPPGPPVVPEVRIRQERSSLMNWVAGYVSSLYHTLLMISFVPFLVYFMLSWGDHVGHSFLATYQPGDRIRAGRSWQAIADIARAYVVGNVILGLIISLVSCLVFYSWQLPYWLLVGFISGFLSLIPYVGLPMAMIAPVLSALMTYDAITPYLVISLEVAVIHLLALNLLYPAVVGGRVHLNPLAVTVALMFWGTIWGGIGLILAIPITAAVKAYLDNTQSMQGYGRLLGDQQPAGLKIQAVPKTD